MGFDQKVLDVLGRKEKTGNNGTKLSDWTEKNQVPENAQTIAIGIAGKYTGLNDSYASILKALEHAATHNNAKVEISWFGESPNWPFNQ